MIVRQLSFYCLAMPRPSFTRIIDQRSVWAVRRSLSGLLLFASSACLLGAFVESVAYADDADVRETRHSPTVVLAE